MILYIRTEKDLYEILKRPSFARHLDQSTYPTGHPLRDDTNKGVLGSFKDEAVEGRQIQAFVGLRSKMYAYRYSSKDEGEQADKRDGSCKAVMRAKGIKTGWVSSRLRFDDYKRTLMEADYVPEKAEFNLIRSKHFDLLSTTVVKKSLSANDDKRQILDCGLRTLPHGHWRLRVREEVEEGVSAEEDGASDAGGDDKSSQSSSLKNHCSDD